MYSNSSVQYWKKRSKPNHFKAKISVVIVLTMTFFVLVNHHSSQRRKEEERRRTLLERKTNRPNPTEQQFQMCEANMRDNITIECSKLCQDELVSIPRPTMHESCIHGCSRSIYTAAVIGCRMGSIEDAFQLENRHQAMNSCSRYQHVDPQPFVLSTCRKYYREGTKAGRNLGYNFINKIIDAYWEKIRNEI